MWDKCWREDVWARIEGPWDLIVIGGGITGAGIFNAAARAGIRVLLVEARDFAFGTSSRSSKLVHGGLRYLRNRQFRVTAQSVRERERLIREAPNLVLPIECLLPCYIGAVTPCWQHMLGVTLYDLLAPKWAHGHYGREELLRRYPPLASEGLKGGCHYFDAKVDDARLVLRVLQEGVLAGGVALSYAPVAGLLRRRDGRVCGVALQDAGGSVAGRSAEIHAPVVINAAGPWCDELRAHVGAAPRLRKLRGSHLLFRWERLPLRDDLTILHPRDNRAVFVFPWEGVTLIGSTDLDHPPDLEAATPEPAITPAEVDYLLEAAQRFFPDQGLGEEDVICTFAGLRPTVASPVGAPSRVSRAHVIWQEEGLLTITSGKLTTYRLMAHHALHAVRERLPGPPRFDQNLPTLQSPPGEPPADDLPLSTWLRLAGRYGGDAPDVVAAAGEGELEPVEGLPAVWAELRWGARGEGALHLDDLLLRRTRLGLTLPCGGLRQIGRIRAILQAEMGWDDPRWDWELERYTRLWQACYDIPGADRDSGAQGVTVEMQI